VTGKKRKVKKLAKNTVKQQLSRVFGEGGLCLSLAGGKRGNGSTGVLSVNT
jgi:hypothetical protein